MSTLVRANAWMEHASDWLNPILVKETRQALKSRQFIVTFLLMLIASWLISVFGTLMAGDSLEFGSAGRGLFTAYYVVLALAIFVVVPYSAYRGLLNERDHTTLELLNITSLSPRQLVWGKLWSAMVQVFIYYSAIAPFIAFTSMLQGFDVALVAFALGISILITLCLTMLTLMLAAIPQGKQFQGLMTGLIFFGLLLVIVVIFSTVPWLLMETILFDDMEFWVAIGGFIVAGMSFFFLFTQIATSHLTFDADNRSTGIRIACSMQFVLYWLVWAFARFMLGSGVFSSTSEAAFIGTWCILHTATIGFFAATEPDFVSRRVRRGIPKTAVSRLLAAPFLPGGHRGFLYLLLHLALVPVILNLFFRDLFATGRSEGWWTITFIAYVVWYVGLGAAFGRLLRRVSAEVRPMHVRVIILLMFAVGSLLPFMPALFGSNPTEYEWLYRSLRVLNPFVFLSVMLKLTFGQEVATSEIFTLAAASGLGLLLNVRPMWLGVMEVLRHKSTPTVTHAPNPALTSDS
ncbi:MAG: hypothetical protein IAG10_24165 [Planctomycetaceae bacterium]|nr:hypothetical protein [Planctomycetaceae bacterium]